MRKKKETLWLADVAINFAISVLLNGLLLTLQIMTKMEILCRFLRKLPEMFEMMSLKE